MVVVLFRCDLSSYRQCSLHPLPLLHPIPPLFATTNQTAPLEVDIPALAITGGFVLILIVAIIISLCVFKAEGAAHESIATIVLSIYDVTTD